MIVDKIIQLHWNQILHEIDLLIEKKQYERGSTLLESWLEAHPEQYEAYLYLGLLYLLQEREEDAQFTWMIPALEIEDSEQKIDLWIRQVALFLKQQALHQYDDDNTTMGCLLLQHIKIISPNDLENRFTLLLLILEDNKSCEDEIQEILDLNLLFQFGDDLDNLIAIPVLEKISQRIELVPNAIDFLESCRVILNKNVDHAVYFLMRSAVDWVSRSKWLDPSVRLAKLALQLDPENFEALSHLSGFYYSSKMYDEGIAIAQQCLGLVESLPQRIHAHSMLMRGVMGKGGEWQYSNSIFNEGKFLFDELINSSEIVFDETAISCLFNVAFFHPYMMDNPQVTRALQNRISNICQSIIDSYSELTSLEEKFISPRDPKSKNSPLKVGYLCHCFRSHSVGWLARTLIKNHNPQNIETYGYFVAYRSASFDALQEWYVEAFDNTRKLGINAQEIAKIIRDDSLDLLIDLDSITLDISFEVMAMRPAPIQATWLGLDASGLPSIDYFIADRYVLPADADALYSEKIVRLPETYLAVEGFEVGIPTITRQDLNIPDDAIIYLTCQSGTKRHVDTVRDQLKIIASVPNSYLLIKGFSDQLSIIALFEKIAQDQGVETTRLRFLENTASEAIHRANLRIADVVLDTYPYNGATTTMETLWMEVPIVTRVGKQFAARNSYTMMMNAGITEGISWSSEEYIEWGIRLGTDRKLRQEICWKLRQSKQSSPLWNGKQFARNMEAAYQEMYEIYIKSNPPQ